MYANTQQVLCLGEASIVEKYPGSFYFAENTMQVISQSKDT